jgi:hypothetical protein
VGVAYRAPDGTMLPTVPEDLDLLEKCEVREGAKAEGSCLLSEQ